jgi:L-ascorbate metabolism protein UlaG (beta-lactamase superfamily)
VKPTIILGLALGALVTTLLVHECDSSTIGSSDRLSGSRFHNRANTDYSLWEEIRVAWQLKTKKKNWPARFETSPYRARAEPVLRGVRVLWIGHSTTLIQTPRLNILTDPIMFDSIGPGPFGLKTVTNPGVMFDSLPAIDIILISHNHYDHLDLKSLHALYSRQPTNPPRILIGLGGGGLLRSEGFSSFIELDWNESVSVNGTRVHFLEAIHTSRRGLWDKDKALWGSFLIESPGGTIYFAGDSAYGGHFREIYERYGAPIVSLLPIGAYEPRWFMFRMHMNPEEAVLAHLDLHSEYSIGIHFGLIDNAGESYDAPVNDLSAARRAHGIEGAKFVAPRYGQIFVYE